LLRRSRWPWRPADRLRDGQSSKLGKVMVAVRDAESRTRFLGYRPEYVKLFAFTVSAMMAGIAGALYVPQVGIINPGEFAPGQLHRGRHLDGGRRARHDHRADHRRVLVNFGKTWFTGALPEYWLFALGALFIVVTLFLPKGIVGLWGQVQEPKSQANRKPASRRPLDTKEPAGPAEKTMAARNHALSRRRLGRPSTASRRSTICRSSSKKARCAPSSAPMAPARRP
jgi:hypothetical protein